jgi:signal recognition particle receptor subunit beta
MKYKVTMICKEISKVVVFIDNDNDNQEEIKDKAWTMFDSHVENNLEQENYTKVEPS